MADQSLTRRVTCQAPDKRMNLSFICDGDLHDPVDLHDFSNNGVLTSDWNIDVQVTQSHELDDTEGEVLKPTKLEPGARHYTVIAMRYVEVVIKNQSMTTPLEFKPVWVGEHGDECDEEAVELGLADTTIATRKLYSFRKDYIEDRTSWSRKRANKKCHGP
jgi:hypothetical protein